LTYVWSLDEKPAQSRATLSNATIYNPTLPIDKRGSYLLRLIVRDGTLDSAPDQVRIDTTNSAPVAAAGVDASAFINETVLLDGSASSDVDGDQLRFNWSLIERPPQSSALLQGADTDHPSFTLDRAGNYIAELVVNDGLLDSVPDQVVISTENSRPIADAGADQAATLGQTVALDGSASSDPDLDPLGYAWSFTTRPAGSTVAISDNTLAAASFVPDAIGDYIAQLIVRDAALDSVPDTAIVTVAASVPTNQPPVVDAGADQTITLPAVATLAGTATDDGKPNPPAHLTTTWSLVSGPPSGVVFGSPTTLNTSATFTAPGVYRLRLTAGDSLLSRNSDLQVTVSDGPPEFQAIADRTIALGTRYQQLLVASDANVGDTLSFALPTAPTGAALSPSPLIDWTPTAAQLGSNTFTATVADTGGHTATTTFHVTVEHTNQAPQLAPQANVILPVGTAFSRTLQATDPDAGDTLTFALVSGPAGMTLTGGALTWPTAGIAPGDAAVTVSVTDAGGLTDSRQFTVTLTPAAPGPVARDDSYTAKVSQVLTVPAAGVLTNDAYEGIGTLSAARLTDPGVGTLTAFNSDGGFTYQAPATVPGDPLTATRLWNANATWSYGAHELVADLNGDGYPDIISHNLNSDIRARSGRDGSQLWALDFTGASDCAVMTGGAMNHRVLADIDDSGHPAYILTTRCSRAGSPQHDNLVAFDHLGKLKWVSPPLSKPHPDNSRGAPTVPPGGLTIGGLAWERGLSLARLSADGPPVLLMNVQLSNNDGDTLYHDTSARPHYAGCRAVTGLPADENVACRATLIISGSDGSVLQTLVVRDPATTSSRPGGPNALWQMPPIAMDLDGDGRVDLVSGTAVWMQNAGGGFDLGWHLSQSVNDTAVADLDGDGKAEIIHVRSSGEPNRDNRGIFLYSYDGQLKRRIPLDTYWFTPLTIADVDGDGRSDIVLGADGTVYAFRDDGQPIWAYQVPVDVPDNSILAPYFTQPVESFRVANAAPQVYDLDGDGLAEVVFSANARIMILNGRSGLRKLDPYWTFSNSYVDVSALMLLDMNNDGHVDVVQNSAFTFNCGFVGFPVGTCDTLVGPIALTGGGSNNWLPGPKAYPHVQYRSTAIDGNARVLHDPKVSRIFRTPEQQGTVRDPRLVQAASFTYAASAGSATTAPATVVIDIVPDNRPPVFTSTPPKSLVQAFAPNPPGGLVTNYYDLAAIDPDPGDTITFSIKSAPTNVTLVSPARIRFEPTCGSYGYPCDWGWTKVIVTATDSRGADTDQIFIVNLTTATVAVPNVVGMTFDAASTALIAAGLQGVKWVESFSALPAGTVLAQDAVAGAVVGRFDDIRLTVSKGPQPFTMPFVVGDQLAPTNALLTGAGLTVNVTRTSSTTIPVGEIMAQSPAAGTELLPATAAPVALTVSAGGPLPMPIASIVLEPGPGPLLRLAGDELQYRAVAILTDGTSANVTLTAAWSSSATSTATIGTTGIAKAIQVGATTISASLDGKTVQGTLDVAARALGGNTPPTAAITSSADGGAVTGPMPIVGTASDVNFLRYELAYALAGEEKYTLITEGTTAVTDGTLGTLDPTMLVNDQYTLRLTVFDRAENQSVATRTVQLTGNRKIGLFSLTFDDLTIPMSGIPLTVSRTYDSRDKAKGDFGVGWRLGLQTLRLRTNRVLGTGWVRTVAGIVVTLSPTDAHKVSLTLPDGHVEEFDMVVSPTSNIGSLDFTNVTGFQPRSGTLGQLQALGNNSLLIASGGAQVELVDDATLNTYSPTLYRYTGADGTQVEISPTVGVQKVTDLNGNTLTFGPAGIIHSAGKSITFTRDPLGRITQITDPLGNVQNYSYDGNGDLVAHANAVGNISRYAYNRSHGLIDIQDPAGNHPARNDYDAGGRLIATTDARGNQITYTHNPGTSQELVRDRLGNPTLFEYDAMGNVLTETNALDNTRTYTYDSRNNQLTETDPLGRVSSKTYDSKNSVLASTDFDGNVTTTTYNANGQVLTRTDPEGHTTTNLYDSGGNLLQVTDPEGGVASNTYDAAGNRLTAKNPLGQVTAFVYDAAGNQISSTDPFGNTSTSSYDSNGRLLSSTDALGRTEHTAYDAVGRATVSTDRMGNTSTLSYSPIGNGQKVARRVDPLGRVTGYGYDADGNHVSTTNPDGSLSLTSFDANARRVAQTDPDRDTTTFVLDAIGRRIQTKFADGTTNATAYDAAGRVATQTDERGKITTYAYAPNRQTITDALGNVTQQEFDSSQRLLRLTDALVHVTSYVYDSLGNLSRTTFPDATFATASYDAARQQIADTDQAGRTTRFAYDAKGQLLQVTDAVGGITTYAYDAVGNRVAQSDANGHVTQMSYDGLGRLVGRTLPTGEQESYAYYANGNRASHTDYNGKTTTYLYDAMDQLVQTNLPGAGTIRYGWTPTGLRTQAGGDTYAYSVRGQLLQERKATGETITYTYDAAGNKASITTPQSTTTYGYDDLNRLQTVVAAAGTTHYSYDAVGNLATVDYPNGIKTTQSYDALNRLMQVANTGTGGLLSSYTYAYGRAGNRTHVMETGPATTGRTVTYSDDDVYRLTQEQVDEPGAANDLTISYSYDAVGNRTRMQRNGTPTSYVYDNRDRLLTETSGAVTQTATYDNNGNLLARGDGAVTDAYAYDAENRLIAAAMQSGTHPGPVAYTYDADGMRIGRTAGGLTTAFLLDKNQDNAQVVVETAGPTVSTFTYGRRLIAQTRTGTGTAFYLSDGQLSTRQLAAPAGAVSDAYTYDAFGVPLAAVGTTPNAYRYAGEQFDSSVGLYYLRARYYAPQSGRFITQDPFDGVLADPLSLHRYLYARANPVDFSDPTGKNFDPGSIMITMTLISGLANVTSFVATFTGHEDIALVAGGIGLMASLFNPTVGMVKGMAQKYVVKKVAQQSAAYETKKLLENAAAQATIREIERRAAKVAVTEVGKGMVKTAAQDAAFHIDEIMMIARAQFNNPTLRRMEIAAIEYTRANLVLQSRKKLEALSYAFVLAKKGFSDPKALILINAVVGELARHM
jgi:RHS repeat-associated protein